MTGRSDWLTVGGDGVTLRVRVTPRAARDAIGGLVESDGGPRLTVSVRAIADKGAANASVEAVIAKAFGVGKSAVCVVGGRKSRQKTISVKGDPNALAQAATQLVEAT